MIDTGSGRNNRRLTVTAVVIFSIILAGLFTWPFIKPLTSGGGNTAAAASQTSKRRPARRKASRKAVKNSVKLADPVSRWLALRKASRRDQGEALGIGMQPQDVCQRDAVETAYYMVPEEDGQRNTQLALRLTPDARKTLLKTSQYAFDNPPYTGTVKQSSGNSVQCEVKVASDNKMIGMTFARQPDGGWAATQIDVPSVLIRPAPTPGT